MFNNFLELYLDIMHQKCISNSYSYMNGWFIHRVKCGYHHWKRSRTLITLNFWVINKYYLWPWQTLQNKMLSKARSEQFQDVNRIPDITKNNVPFDYSVNFSCAFNGVDWRTLFTSVWTRLTLHPQKNICICFHAVTTSYRMINWILSLLATSLGKMQTTFSKYNMIAFSE